MYWGGKDSEHKKHCGDVLVRIAREEFEGLTSSEVLQEIIYRFWAVKDIGTGQRIFDEFRSVVHYVLPVTDVDVCLARELSEKYSCGPRDLLHAAVMRGNDIGVIISVDKHFDLIDGLRRVEPSGVSEWLSEQ